MQSKLISIVRWAGAVTMLLLIVMLMIEGTWAVPLHRGWPFVGLSLLSALLLAIALLSDLRHRRWAAALSHAGLLLVLLGAMMGAVVERDLKMVVDRHAFERVGYTSSDRPEVLPFALRLDDFRIDYYDDGTSPRQYTSDLRVDDCSVSESVSVNHPWRYRGWWIYQSDYDRANQDFVILELVYDPLLWLVYLGFALLVAGAVAEMRKAWHSRRVVLVVLVLTVLFTAASVARISLGTLVPALRSLWFFPHILIYMIAYSLLAIALVMALVALFSRPAADRPDYAWLLLRTASSLLLVGMLCGAVWAKDAWGHYWTWDAKECWAAVTWLITIVGMHLPQPTVGMHLPCPKASSARRWRTLIVVLLTFAAMQVTWYGVNYLPSAEYSMHTYNSK